MSLRDQLQAIYDQHGKLTPELVVQEARDKSHPLHHRVFDRNQREAAAAWYHHRAEELIRSVKIKYADTDDGPKEVRVWHAVRRDGSYEPVERIAEDPFQRKLLLNMAEREWKQLLVKYEHLEEFLAMVTSDLEAAVA